MQNAENKKFLKSRLTGGKTRGIVPHALERDGLSRTRRSAGEKFKIGGLAQMGERLPCKQEGSGSIPLISTSEEIIILYSII